MQESTACVHDAEQVQGLELVPGQEFEVYMGRTSEFELVNTLAPLCYKVPPLAQLSVAALASSEHSRPVQHAELEVAMIHFYQQERR